MVLSNETKYMIMDDLTVSLQHEEATYEFEFSKRTDSETLIHYIETILYGQKKTLFGFNRLYNQVDQKLKRGSKIQAITFLSSEKNSLFYLDDVLQETLMNYVFHEEAVETLLERAYEKMLKIPTEPSQFM